MSKSNIFWVESQDEFKNEKIVAHGFDEETDEMYYQFMSRAAANKHLKAEKKIDPHLKFRVVRQVIQTFKTQWE